MCGRNINMNVLFITSDLYPIPSPVGLCVYTLIKYMSHFDEIHILCTNSESLPFNNVHIHSVSNPVVKKKHLINRILSKRHYPIQNPLLLKKFMLSAKRILSMTNIDIVISTFNPAEAIYTGIFIKKFYKIHFVLYNLDSLQLLSHSYSKMKRLKLKVNSFIENIWFKKADTILLINSHIGLYTKAISRYLTKIIITDYPLFEPISNLKDEQNLPLKAIFSGSLYKNLREPMDTINILKKVDGLKIYFYVNNDFKDYLIKESISSKGKIIVSDFIDLTELNSSLFSADILINIGNKKSNQVPSKIFTYMSYSKPIINFYSDKSDVSLDYLNQYPYALNVHTESINDDTIAQVQHFINQIGSNRIKFKNIHDLFPMNKPSHTIKIIEGVKCK